MSCIRKITLITLVVLLLMQPYTAFAASTISSVIRIDASGGRIKGMGADYTFIMPGSWQNGSVIVNRERRNNRSPFLDKLIFLYIPIDKISMPTVFAMLYVCENKPGLEHPGSRKLLETDKYIFMLEPFDSNHFSEPADRLALDQYIASISNDSMMASQIEIPPSQHKIPNNTITVNGRLLRNQAVRGAIGTIYIPIRETCNALGYSVSWNAHDFEITLYSNDRRHVVPIHLKSSFSQNYSTMIINDRSYITSVFFMRVLNANIEVDERNNIVINTVVEP